MTLQFGPEYVRAISPYQGGKPISEVARELGLEEASIIKMASNENPLGMPESARLAMIAEMAEIGRYPDANGFELKAALSAHYDVPEDWITLGNGSNDILCLAAQAFVEAGQSVVFSQYGFIVYALATQVIGARSIVVPAKDYGNDLEAMLAAIDDDTRLIFIANPNNPTGTFLSSEDLESFLKAVPSHVVVVLDEAYNEYLDSRVQYDSTAWVKQFPNLLISRTFSKAYGLAGMRVGFGIAQPMLTDLLNRIRQPFNTNALAQAAAIAALNDTTFLEKSAKLNADGYQTLTAAFDEMGLAYIPSFGNFVTVKVADDAQTCANINQQLLEKGVIVRGIAGYGLPEWLRVSIGLPEENARFLDALKEILSC